MTMKHPVQQYFEIAELICPHVSARFGDNAWQFFDERLLDTLYAIRRNLDLPIYVNNWAIGGQFSQRGLRCNVCALVKEKTMLDKVYMTAHMQGEAVDFDVKGMTAEEVRTWLERNQVLLPYPIRVESGTTWVHIDLRNPGTKKIIYF